MIVCETSVRAAVFVWMFPGVAYDLGVKRNPFIFDERTVLPPEDEVSVSG